MMFNYYFRLAFIAMASGALISCSAGEDADICSNHQSVHDEHIDKVVQVEMDYSSSTRLIASTSVPLQLSNESNNALLMKSTEAIQVNTRGSCQHQPVAVTERGGRIIYQYEVICGNDSNIDHIETRILDMLPEVSEIDVSISSPATTKNFVLHRDCSSPIYKYL